MALLVVTAARGGGNARVRPRRPLRRARRRTLHRSSAGVVPADGPQGPRLRARPRRAGALRLAYGEIASSIYFALGIVAASALGLTPLVLLAPGAVFLPRLALLRRGDGRDPGDRRCRDVHPPRVQRPRRLRHRIGALPRLPDRDRPLGALPAALRRRALVDRAARAPVGHRRRRHAPSR